MLVVKNLPASAGEERDGVQYLGWEDAQEEEMATHCSILAQRILWTEGAGTIYLCYRTYKSHTNWLLHLLLEEYSRLVLKMDIG